ncbi:MAG: phosphotransferase [Candidatus Berkiella sp.]
MKKDNNPDKIEKKWHMNDTILKTLNENYGLAVHTLTPLSLGADRQAELFKADTQDKSYFIKLKQGDAHTVGVRIVEMLAKAGLKHVVSPIKTLKSQTTLPFNHHTLIVYPFIDGSDGFNQSLTDEQWISLGKALKTVHDLPLPKSIRGQLRQENYSPQWRDLLTSLYTQIDNLKGTDASSATLLAFLRKNKETIMRIVENATMLAKEAQKQSLPFVLCHSDIHGGNVLLDDNGGFYIVDWDEPILAPKERDLMFIGGGVANVWNQPHEQALFYEGYGESDINSLLVAYYRSERIVVDIVEFADALLFSTDGDADDRAELLEYFLAMFELNGVVDIALDSTEVLKKV